MPPLPLSPLVLELSAEQRARIDRVAGRLNATPEDVARMMIFSGLDAEVDWLSFNEHAQYYLDATASSSASAFPEGGRVEDETTTHPFKP